MKTVKNQTYLIIYGSYQELVVGLFEGPRLIAQVQRENIRLSAHLLCCLDQVLQQAGKQLADLAFIAVCQGPGSFSSLRALIASVNGIAVATGIPLIGLDGLEAVGACLAAAVPRGTTCVTLAALNAYNNEIYYLIELVTADGARSRILPPGYTIAENIVASITEFGFPIRAAGNSAAQFVAMLGPFIVTEIPCLPSDLLQAFAVQADQKWSAGDHATSLQPTHLKTLQFKKLA